MQINGKFTELSHKFRGMDSILTFLRYETTSLAQIKGRKYTFVMNVVRQGEEMHFLIFLFLSSAVKYVVKQHINL